MYGCEILFDAETAASIRHQLMEAMGDASPCERCAVAPCPLLPADLGPLLASPGTARAVLTA